MTAPKNGDHVKVAIEGVVTHVYDDGDISIRSIETGWSMAISPGRGCTVEVVAPPIPQIVGTICRSASGKAVELTKQGWRQDGWGPYTYAEAEQLWGPLVEMVAINR